MKKMSVLLMLLLAGIGLLAQSRVIKGKVTDDKGEPLTGATVVVKGEKATALTDATGSFSLSAGGTGNVTLIISFTGKRTLNVSTDGVAPVLVKMETDLGQLEDVVVIGYTSVRRKDVLASVASVGAKDIKDIPINSAAEALNGRLAGVTATTAEGSPDSDVRVRVRGGMSITGDNSPLYVIDGVQMENALNFIAPQDIKTIDVLKDAAATAIYGARGANGVIVITTKGGRTGKLKVNYNGFVGVRELASKLKVLDPYDFVIYQSERSRGNATDSINFTRNFGTTWDTLQVYKSVPAVDWQDETFGRTGILTTHIVTMDGGNRAFTYNLGYTYNYEKAIVLNSDYRRNLFSGRFDYRITNDLKIGGSVRYNNQDVNGAGVSDDRGTAFNRLRNAVRNRPFLSDNQAIDEDDPLADPNVGNGLILVNPISLTNAEYRNKVTNTLNGTAYLDYRIGKGFTFRSTFGYIRLDKRDIAFYDSISPISILNGASQPITRLDTTEQTTITNNNVLQYAYESSSRRHKIDVMLGQETYDLRTETRSHQYRDFPNFISPEDAFKDPSQGNSFAGFPTRRASRYTSLSFFGRINYSYQDKYLFSFNIRRDGASKFGEANRWANFPSVSVAWRVKRENFMRNVEWINDLKLRASIGTIGNNRIQDYLFVTTFNNDGALFYGVNNRIDYALYSASLVNPNLKWESTESRNIGLDATLFNSRVQLAVDVYDNRSRDLLLNVPVAPTFGYSTQIQNMGRTSNRGVEIQLGAALMKNQRGFNWNANLNISLNRNKILALGPGQEFFFAPPAWGVSGQPQDYIQKIGSPVGSIYGLVTDGIYEVSDFDYDAASMKYTLKPGIANSTPIIGVVQPGSIKFKDLNGDGRVDLNNDRQIIGDPTPDFTGGLNQTFSYGRWDASLFVNFSVGNDIYNANRIEFTNGYTNNANMLAEMGERWKIVTPTGATSQWIVGNNAYGLPPEQLLAINSGKARIWQPIRGNGAFFPHSWAIEDGSFLRINNLTVGYSIPASNLKRVRMSMLRFYFTANNLHVFTNYTGYDPEVSVRSNPLTPNLDYSAYPKSRSFIFGINASF
jgi:TonB-linked SusC/RagA family outer membrane protein